MVAPTLKALYDSLVRNQWAVPPMKDPLMSKAFMLGIIASEYWCIKTTQLVAYRVCADPPARKDLSKIVADILDSFDYVAIHGARYHESIRATAARIRKVGADVKWLVLVLA